MPTLRLAAALNIWVARGGARAEAEAKAQLAEANARVAELAGKLASLAERQQAIAATPWWRRGRMAMKLFGPGGE